MKFWRPLDDRGNIIVIFSLMAIPLIGIVGLAVDSARAYSVKQRLQESIDAAALVAGRNFNDPHRDQMIKDYFYANWRDGYMGTAKPTLVFNSVEASREVNVTASVTMPTLFMRMFNIDNVKVGALTSSVTGLTYLEVALALDNTASMSTMIGAERRIDAMKKAAKNFLDTLYDGEEVVPQMWVSLIPFTSMVNVGNQHTSFLAPNSTNNIVWDYPKNTTSQNSWRGCVFERSFYIEGSYAGRDMTDDSPAVEAFWPYHVTLPHWETYNACTAKLTPSFLAPAVPGPPAPVPPAPPVLPCTKIGDNGSEVPCKVLDNSLSLPQESTTSPADQAIIPAQSNMGSCQYGQVLSHAKNIITGLDLYLYKPALSYQTVEGFTVQYPSPDGIKTTGYNAAYPALATNRPVPSDLTASYTAFYPNGNSGGATTVAMSTTIPYVYGVYDLGDYYPVWKVYLDGVTLTNPSTATSVNGFKIQGSNTLLSWTDIVTTNYTFSTTSQNLQALAWGNAKMYRYVRIVRDTGSSPADAGTARVKINAVRIIRPDTNSVCCNADAVPAYSTTSYARTDAWTINGRWIAPWPNATNPIFGGWGNSGCGLPLMPLTAKKSDLVAKIDSMDIPSSEAIAYGGTIINEGLVWGWRTLSPNWRGWWKNSNGTDIDATLPLDYNKFGGSKAVVVMTDGLNLMQDWYALRSDGQSWFQRTGINLAPVTDNNLWKTSGAVAFDDNGWASVDNSAYGILRHNDSPAELNIYSAGTRAWKTGVAFCRLRQAAGFEPVLSVWGCREYDGMIRNNNKPTPQPLYSNNNNFSGNRTIAAAMSGPYYDELMSRLLKTCTAMRNNNVRIFFILFDVANNPVKDSAIASFKTCVGTKGGVFDAANSADLDAAFQEIAVKLRMLRLQQ